jgi:hypothetical protein
MLDRWLKLNLAALAAVAVLGAVKCWIPILNTDVMLLGRSWHIHHGSVAALDMILAAVSAHEDLYHRGGRLTWVLLILWVAVFVDSLYMRGTELSFSLEQIFLMQP